MTTIWNSGEKKSSRQQSGNQEFNKKTISGTILASWSRQQKLATIIAFAMLGVLIVASACSKESAKPALVGVSSPALPPTMPAALSTPTVKTESPSAVTPPARKKPSANKRPLNVTYTDASSGISFLYPRKFLVSPGDKAQPGLDAAASVPMNFVQPGGVTIATVTALANSYPGTDFASAFFTVSVNRNVSEQECSHFGFVDTRNADGEPVDAEKVKIGSTDMEMTSDFSASALKQGETEYYHNFENGACYEYVLGLGTEGYITEGDIKHVDRDEVFAKLGKILATVKINPIERERVAEQAGTSAGSGKE
jgi:hypothetical protein